MAELFRNDRSARLGRCCSGCTPPHANATSEPRLADMPATVPFATGGRDQATSFGLSPAGNAWVIDACQGRVSLTDLAVYTVLLLPCWPAT